MEDCDEPWSFDDNSIDFVHMRYLTGSIKDWYLLLENAYQCITPGGYVESYEAAPYYYSDDRSVTNKSALAQWGRFFVEGGKKINRTFTMVPDGLQREAMEKAGFVDIEEKNIRVASHIPPPPPFSPARNCLELTEV